MNKRQRHKQYGRETSRERFHLERRQMYQTVLSEHQHELCTPRARGNISLGKGLQQPAATSAWGFPNCRPTERLPIASTDLAKKIVVLNAFCFQLLNSSKKPIRKCKYFTYTVFPVSSCSGCTRSWKTENYRWIWSLCSDPVRPKENI